MQWSQCRLMVGTRVLVSTHPRLLQCSLWQHFDELWNEAAFSLTCVGTFCCATDRHEICTDECYPSIEHFLGACPRAVNADAIDAVGIPSRIVEPITITAVKRPDAQAWILSLLRSNWGLFATRPNFPGAVSTAPMWMRSAQTKTLPLLPCALLLQGWSACPMSSRMTEWFGPHEPGVACCAECASRDHV